MDLHYTDEELDDMERELVGRSQPQTGLTRDQLIDIEQEWPGNRSVRDALNAQGGASQ